MKLITQRMLIERVADAWERQYCGRNDRKDTFYKDIMNTLANLRALDLSTATAEQVNSIIGHEGLTTLRCDQCKQDVLAVVQVGEAPAPESATAELCRDCAQAAFAMIANA